MLLVSLCLVDVMATGSMLADGKVHELTTATFDAAIRAYPLSFVEFYAPWCGHCKKLVPEWEKTAELARSSNILVAKVDAIAEKQLAQTHGVQGFPTLKLFRGDPAVVKKFEGARTADKMAEWLEVWKRGPIVDSRIDAHVFDVAAIRSWSAKVGTVAVLGLKSGNAMEDAAMNEVLTAAAFVLNAKTPNGEIPVAVTIGNPAAISELGVTGRGVPSSTVPSVVVFRNFDFEDKIVGYSPADHDNWSSVTAYTDFMAWFEKNRLPALIPGKEDTEKFFLSNIVPGNGVVLLLGGDEAATASVQKVAVKYTLSEKRLKWVHAMSNDFGISMAKSVGLDSKEFPDVVVWEFGETDDDDKVYRLSQHDRNGKISESSVSTFIADWQSGQLSAGKDPVIAVTSDTFESVVIQSGKDVLVEFYAPWCGHCKSLAPEYKKLAKIYENDVGVSIVKVDATQHKHPSAEVKSYPTLKFYQAGTSGNPIDLVFKANRNSESMKEFIEQNRRTSPAGAKASKNTQKEDCPQNADFQSCASWCEGVSPLLTATLSGKACKDSGVSGDTSAPQCMCYDKDFKDLYAMCKSVCSPEFAGSCAVGDKTCMAGR